MRMMPIQMLESQSDSQIARWLEDLLGNALAQSAGGVAITVPGGSTPFPILSELARSDLNWSRIEVWPGDDRIVAEGHAASNVGRIRSLLEPVGARIVPLSETADPPHFALTWLGMGEDGHVASLFPNTDPRTDDPQLVRRLTPDPLPPEAPFDRLSLTIPALQNSDALLLVIRGQAKRALFEAAARGENDLPVARLLRAASQPVTCFT
jgi:6-phosphogluconolactonase